MITSQQVRIILDRNQHGLDGLPRVAAGRSLAPGTYWDPYEREVISCATPQTAIADVVLLSHDPDISVDRLVRQMAMGGGGRSGRARPYHARAASAEH
ncbi:MAG: hypothetical protein FJ033_02740 [Chloroflexi bacterium]|nr:hypothetical protein [Chloroflexota bacterium]